MGPLVASGDARAEARVRGDLERIADAVYQAFPALISLAVIGAFGRGEGAVVATVDGYAPWNDYDLLLITPTRQGWNRIAPLCGALRDEMALPGLDIVPFVPGDLQRSAGTMLVQDARACHVLLRGSDTPLRELPPRQVPLREALILLVNRLVCLLEYPPEDLTGYAPDSLHYASQVSKAVLAVVDATLVKHAAYAVSYREKVARFKELAPEVAQVRAAEEALAFRLRPEPVSWRSEAWHQACTWLLDAVAATTGIPGAPPRHLAAALWRRRFPPPADVVRSLVRRRLPDTRRRAVECAEVLVLGAAREAGEERAAMLDSARRYLRRTGPTGSFADWPMAANETVRRWFEVCYT